jgi:hypothetical protein
MAPPWIPLTHSPAEVRTQTALEIHYTQAGGISGHFMLFIMLLMYTTAYHKVRHQCFEAFWYTHHLAFFFIIGMWTHATGCFVRDSVKPDYTYTFPYYSTEHCLGYESWRYLIWPGLLYIGERVWREIRARQATRLSKVLVHPSGQPYPCLPCPLSNKNSKVPWSCASSSPASSTSPGNGFSSKFRRSRSSSGIL